MSSLPDIYIRSSRVVGPSAVGVRIKLTTSEQCITVINMCHSHSSKNQLFLHSKLII